MWTLTKVMTPEVAHQVPGTSDMHLRVLFANCCAQTQGPVLNVNLAPPASRCLLLDEELSIVKILITYSSETNATQIVNR